MIKMKKERKIRKTEVSGKSVTGMFELIDVVSIQF